MASGYMYPPTTVSFDPSTSQGQFLATQDGHQWNTTVNQNTTGLDATAAAAFYANTILPPSSEPASQLPFPAPPNSNNNSNTTDLSPSGPTSPKPSKSVQQPVEKPTRVRMSREDLLELVRCCIDLSKIHDIHPITQFWVKVTAEFEARTGKPFRRCRDRMKDFVKARRAWKAHNWTGSEDGEMERDLLVDQWIQILDGAGLAQQDTMDPSAARVTLPNASQEQSGDSIQPLTTRRRTHQEAFPDESVDGAELKVEYPHGEQTKTEDKAIPRMSSDYRQALEDLKASSPSQKPRQSLGVSRQQPAQKSKRSRKGRQTGAKIPLVVSLDAKSTNSVVSSSSQLSNQALTHLENGWPKLPQRDLSQDTWTGLTEYEADQNGQIGQIIAMQHDIRKIAKDVGEIKEGLDKQGKEMIDLLRQLVKKQE